MLEVLPSELLDRKKKEAVIIFLRDMNVPRKYKKYLIVEWTKFTGEPLTVQLLEAIGIGLI